MLTFSITIPNLNQSHFLSTCLESIKIQTVNSNVALIDGGSADNFKEVAEKYSDIICFMRSRSDEGQAFAIREGLERLSGDIISWLNADDYYYPSTLDKVVAIFEKYDEVDIVYGDAIHVTPEGFFLSYFPSIQEFNANELTRTCFICQPACFVRREAYERVGGLDPKLVYTMDWDLWCRLSKSGARFYYLHDVLAAVRYYHGTKTLSRSWRRYLELWRIEKNYGGRLLPRTWLGSYLFDLNFKKVRRPTDGLALALLTQLRTIKKCIIKKYGTNKTPVVNYGFHPWETTVEGTGTIHIPWYSNMEWSKLRLKVNPLTENYRVTLNGKKCEKIEIENGTLVVDLPELIWPHRVISIESMDSRLWKLLEFSCDVG